MKNKFIQFFLFLVAQPALASEFDQMIDFSKYLETGSPALDSPQVRNENFRVGEESKRHLLGLEIELGSNKPTEYFTSANSGTSFSSRAMKANSPEVRASLDLFFSSHFSTQFSFTHFEQAQTLSQSTNFNFDGQTIAAGQSFSVRNTVEALRGVGVYDLNPMGFLRLGLGVGLTYVHHKTTVFTSNLSLSPTKGVVAPLLFLKTRLDLLGPLFVNGDMGVFPFDERKVQFDGSVGVGLAFENLTLRGGSRWFKSAFEQYEYSSSLTTQSFFVSVRYGFGQSSP